MVRALFGLDFFKACDFVVFVHRVFEFPLSTSRETPKNAMNKSWQEGNM
jgi:hypothetical protein